MTDEERQKLVADLREFTGLDNEPWLVRVGREAADEIERLAAKNNASMLETAADLLERLAHELVATNKRLEQLEARLEALERM